jgi:2',3'-cyclic-nucleotide 2'-phosphodiesterase (5'-nucleotidase family)
LTHRATFLPPDLHIVDWQTILPKLLQKLSKECDHIILLSNLPEKENVEIAKGYPDIHIILSADPKFGNFGPVLTNNTLISQTTNQGKYLGMLNIEWGSSGRWESDLEKERSVLDGRIDAINLQIQKMESRKDTLQDNKLRLEQAITERKSIAQQIESLNQKTREDGIIKGTPSTFTSNFIALNSSLPDNADIEKIISGMKQRIRDIKFSQHNNTTQESR